MYCCYDYVSLVSCHKNRWIDPIGCVVTVIACLLQMEEIIQGTIRQALLQEHHFNELLVQDQLPC